MKSHNGRFILILNGEIYNFHDLSEDLLSLGHQFRGSSDTEVLLAAIETWGLESTLDRVHGMYSFALVDRASKRLFLIRDRLGEKPLYYSFVSGNLVFGSEIKALRSVPWWRGEICPEATSNYFAFNYVPDPLCIYKDTFKVPAGHFLSISISDPVQHSVHRYWNITEYADARPKGAEAGDPVRFSDQFEKHLSKSIRRQLIADVPIGTFLSGGVDSSLVTAIAQRESKRTIRSFTVGFEDAEFDESRDAAKIAEILGTDHTEVRLSLDAALDLIPTLNQTYDEPFGDSSSLPTILVSRAAKQHVTVILGGDGADEIQGGYARYADVLGRANLDGTSGSLLGNKLKIFRFLAALLGGNLSGIADYPNGSFRHKLQRRIASLSERLSLESDEERYQRSVRFWLHRRNPAGDYRRLQETNLVSDVMWRDDPLKSMMLFDSLTYLPGDILTKVDRAAMGVSLETRLPYLDHALVQFCMECPSSIHRLDGRPKWLSRQVLEKMIHAHSFDQPKKGFSIPIDKWLRGPLKAWASELLDADRLRGISCINEQPIIEEWALHQSGRMNRGQSLWGVLMFLDFLQHNE